MALSEVKSRIRGIPNILDIHIKHRENPEFLEAVEYVNDRCVKVLSDMNTVVSFGNLIVESVCPSCRL
jgi:hypothetical protein